MAHDNLGFTASTDAVDAKNPSGSSQKDRKVDRLPLTNMKNNVYSIDLGDEKRRAKELETEYDPYENRVVEHPTTNLDTLFHLLKGSLGTGILAMPQAFAHAGYVVGFVGTFVIGLLCTYCIRLLISAEYELCKRMRVPSLTYPATAEAAFNEGPRIFRGFAGTSVHVINAFLLIYQLGTCCVYTVFIAENLQSGLSLWVPVVDIKYYQLGILLPLILINWIRNLKLLAPLSTIANGVTLVSFGVILYYIFREAPSFENRAPVGHVEDFPLYFGTVLFALEAIGVIMPLENEMKTPKAFNAPFGVLNMGMGAIIFLYVGMGFFGYICYGDDVKGSVTLNLAPGEIPAKVVQLLLALSIYFTHALQCYVAVDIVWNDYLCSKVKKESRKMIYEYIVRTAIVVVTFCIAVAIPKLDLFISLFGALCLSALGLAFPAIIDCCAFWKVKNRNGKIFMVAKNGSLVAFGFLGLVVGTWTSLSKIIESFQ
ncbi:proton-coupled amino acid transporter-like protein CG1139 [Venturia canescens]|uniref:proton-coupled amino acid transporter-like protein CG1139 n=1 Tax=Venturia canescens TaxID=32260 RepID=UPI001C9C177B|nr:proton-coupled amino acid transporter-like protein CG1139 [Venturia canescens]